MRIQVNLLTKMSEGVTTIELNGIDEDGRLQPFKVDLFDGGSYKRLKLPPVVSIRNTKHGLGLFAEKDIKANVVVLQTAKLIPYTQTGANKDNYEVSIKDVVYIPNNVGDDGVHQKDGTLYKAGDYSNDLSLMNSSFPFEELQGRFSEKYISSVRDFESITTATAECVQIEKALANIVMFDFVDRKTFVGKTTRSIKAGEELLTFYGASYWIRKLTSDLNQKVRLAAYYVNALYGVSPAQPGASFVIPHYNATQKYMYVSKDMPKGDAALVKGIEFLATQFNNLPENAYNFLITPFLNAASSEKARTQMIKASLPLREHSAAYKLALKEFRGAQKAFRNR